MKFTIAFSAAVITATLAAATSADDVTSMLCSVRLSTKMSSFTTQEARPNLKVDVQYCKGTYQGKPCKVVSIDENTCTDVDPSYNDQVHSLYPGALLLPAECLVFQLAKLLLDFLIAFLNHTMHRHYRCKGKVLHVGIEGENDFDNTVLQGKVSSFKCNDLF
jgi:hypothetical protein